MSYKNKNLTINIDFGMNHSNLSRYVLLEKSPTNAKVIGIFTYKDAVKKKEELSSEFLFNKISLYSYEIQGPFNIQIKECEDNTSTINPFILEPLPPIIESPRLFKKIDNSRKNIIRGELKLEDIDKF